MRSRTSSPSRLRRRVAGLTAVAVASIGLAVSGPALSASAATTPPSVGVSGSNHGLSSTTVTVNPGSAQLLVFFVSADGPAASAVSATVKVNGTTVPLVVSSTYAVWNNAPGYAGVFSTGSNSTSGSKTVTVTLSKRYNVWLDVVGFTGSTGLSDVTSNSGNAGCPAVPFSVTDGANNWLYAVGHDWEYADSPPVVWPGGYGETLGDWWSDTSAGDTNWVEHSANPTFTGESPESLGLTRSPCDGTWNMAGVAVLGS
jgi:hypothetical protein